MNFCTCYKPYLLRVHKLVSITCDQHLYILCGKARVIDWCRHAPQKLWVPLEQDTGFIPIAGLPGEAPKPSMLTPWSFLLWLRLTKYYKWTVIQNFPSPLTSLTGHPEFTPGLSDRVFKSKTEQGPLRATHFLRSTRWISITELLASFWTQSLDKWKAMHAFPMFFTQTLFFFQKPYPFEDLCLGEGPIQKSFSIVPTLT